MVVKSWPLAEITLVTDDHAGTGGGLGFGDSRRFSGILRLRVRTGSGCDCPWMRSASSICCGKRPPTTCSPSAVRTVY